MKSLIAALFILVVSAATTQAQGSTTFWVEERTALSGGETTPRLQGLMNHSFTKQWGSFAWFQVDARYAEAYGGLTYSPREWVQVALGAGVEQADNPLRLGGYIWVGKGRYSGLLLFEHGGSGPWFAVEANVRVTNALGLGGLVRRFEGSGPRLEWNLRKFHAKFWTAVVLQQSRDKPATTLVGVRFNF